MKTLKVAVLIVSAFGLMACLLPGMIPMTPMPEMETNTDTVIETLNGDQWVSLYSLAPEQYSEEETARPGTHTYTAIVTNDLPVYFSYGWCTTDEQILQQNFEHITVALYLNDNEITGNNVHILSFELNNGLVCTDFGVLLSEWPAGDYVLKSVVTFDEEINDGMADYEAGDYITQFNVTIEE